MTKAGVRKIGKILLPGGSAGTQDRIYEARRERYRAQKESKRATAAPALVKHDHKK
jgi:hypothetical protein